MILSNQVKCLKCGDTPFSAHRHDFKYCKCGHVAIDGGMSYCKRVSKDLSLVEDLSIEWEDDLVHKLDEALEWAENTGRNNLGVICALARVFRDAGYEIKKKPFEKVLTREEANLIIAEVFMDQAKGSPERLGQALYNKTPLGKLPQPYPELFHSKHDADALELYLSNVVED